MKRVPPVVRFLQDRSIILSRKEHGLHHNSPFEGNYCILNGVCNRLLDRTSFFRKLERIVFQITGIALYCHPPRSSIDRQLTFSELITFLIRYKASDLAT